MEIEEGEGRVGYLGKKLGTLICFGRNRGIDRLMVGTREVLEQETRAGVEQRVIEKTGKEAELGGNLASNLLRWNIKSEEEMEQLGSTEQSGMELGTS